MVRPEVWSGEVRDAAQVRALVTKFADDDALGDLRELFEVPQLDSRLRDVAVREEGWILGAR